MDVLTFTIAALGLLIACLSFGSQIASWLLDLTAAAFHEDPGLDSFAGSVSDSGEGRWTVQAAVDTGVPAYVQWRRRIRSHFAKHAVDSRG